MKKVCLSFNERGIAYVTESEGARAETELEIENLLNSTDLGVSEDDLAGSTAVVTIADDDKCHVSMRVLTKSERQETLSLNLDNKDDLVRRLRALKSQGIADPSIEVHGVRSGGDGAGLRWTVVDHDDQALADWATDWCSAEHGWRSDAYRVEARFTVSSRDNAVHVSQRIVSCSPRHVEFDLELQNLSEEQQMKAA